MPVSYTFSDALFRLECVGRSTALEVMDAVESAVADPAFPPSAKLLLDVTTSTSLPEQSRVQLHWVAGFLAARSNRFGRRAAVVAPPAMAQTLCLIGAVFAPEFGAEVKIFTDEPSALAWLGVAPPAEAVVRTGAPAIKLL